MTYFAQISTFPTSFFLVESEFGIWNLFSHLKQPNDPKNRKHFSIYDTFL